VEVLGIDPALDAIEMTQHSGDENYPAEYIEGGLHGALGSDWMPDEVNNPVHGAVTEKLRAEVPGSTQPTG
jgi:hypothetical protein